ncbi:MAG: hypothetical protein M3033_13775 [Acidobacteriota bacterium]|nr:hypothetical protein [Acidobacteriota bacterium]
MNEKKLKTLSVLSISATIFLTLCSFYLILAIPGTIAGFEYEKKRLIESIERDNDKIYTKQLVEKAFDNFNRTENAKLFLLFSATIIIISSTVFFLTNFLLIRAIIKKSSKLNE